MSIFQKRELSTGGGTEPTPPRAAVCFTTSAMTRRAADWLARLGGCRPLGILSDHGEEVFDYAHRNGRIHDATLSPDCCRHQYEIPFMIWMSDRYRAARPELAAAIARAVDRPYMTDDLPHLLLDLAGLSCRWFDPTRSVVNDRFDASRPRLLRDDKVDYDLIMRQAKGSAETNKGA